MNRTDDAHRVRSAQHDRLDSEIADRQMNRKLAERRLGPVPVSRAPRGPEPAWIDPAQLAAEIRRTALVPAALAHRCPSCGAAAGVSCSRSVTAVCGTRYALAARYGWSEPRQAETPEVPNSTGVS